MNQLNSFKGPGYSSGMTANSFALFDTVALKRDLYAKEGVASLPTGTVGVIVEVYGDDVYEVEFVNVEGVTTGLCSLRGDALERAVLR